MTFSPMDAGILHLLIAAATTTISDIQILKPRSYATWKETRRDLEFDSDGTLQFLRKNGHDVKDSLIHKYRDIHKKHKPISLSGISKLAPWLHSLDESFKSYSSMRALRRVTKYTEIMTFTTPAVSSDGTVAFLELWTEDGQYAQMGSWYWLQMRLKNHAWFLDWRPMHSIS